ncbi:hypothetical protein E2K80_06790 [Rhodophyticola sp. CCM32]|uniref:GrlR family regulatory protein n=1 Tax=Rhodophyticola sp. CCM32 TaxID=2916397 RepID=UPI00107F366F|nr:GrlR family regulatory protein [Rhodophyticola sp. CCM32]QBY00477.1 hypothetical protein E2K80_06790 [Rhodophyticola sp. CCM32]
MPQLADGTYVVSFESSLGAFGGGTVMIKGYRISGGDIGYLYEGQLEESGDDLVGHVKVTQHDKTMESVFGDIEQFDIDLKGRVIDDRGIFKGAVAGFPMFQLTVRLDLHEKVGGAAVI